MSRFPIDQVFPSQIQPISDEELARIVAHALRQDFGSNQSAIKQIGKLTGVNLRTIGNWYKAGNAPSSGHLLLLARSSQTLLKFILEQIGGGDLADAFYLLKGKVTGASLKEKISSKTEIYSDRFVTIKVAVDPSHVSTLNQRQLWFLGKLQNLDKPRHEDIAKIWQVTERTAKRDIAVLIKMKLAFFQGARKNGCYVCSRKDM